MMLPGNKRKQGGELAKGLQHRKNETTEPQIEFRINSLDYGKTGMKEAKRLARAIKACKESDPDRYRNVLNIDVDELKANDKVDTYVLTAYVIDSNKSDEERIIAGCLAKTKIIYADGFEIPIPKLKSATLRQDFGFIELGALATVNAELKPKGVSLGLAMVVAMMHALMNDGVVNHKSLIGAFLRLIDTGGEHVIPNPLAKSVLERAGFQQSPASAALLPDVLTKALKGRAFLEFSPDLFESLIQEDALQSFVDQSKGVFVFDKQTTDYYFESDCWDLHEAINTILNYCGGRGMPNSA